MNVMVGIKVTDFKAKVPHPSNLSRPLGQNGLLEQGSERFFPESSKKKAAVIINPPLPTWMCRERPKFGDIEMDSQGSPKSRGNLADGILQVGSVGHQGGRGDHTLGGKIGDGVVDLLAAPQVIRIDNQAQSGSPSHVGDSPLFHPTPFCEHNVTGSFLSVL